MNRDFIYKRRLLKLADLLVGLPRKRFDYDRWVGNDWQGASNLSCGTTACALGWATTIPSLRKAGLTLRKRTTKRSASISLKKNIFKRSATTFEAANKIFGVSYEEFTYLFMPGQLAPRSMDNLPDGPDASATPKQVAKHIRRFVNLKYSNG